MVTGLRLSSKISHNWQMGLPLRVRPSLIVTRIITDRIRIHLVSLPLLIAQRSLNSAIFLSKYRSCKRPSDSDSTVTVAPVIKWLQTKHNYAFRDLWNCWQTFRSRPTSWHEYQVRTRTSSAYRSKYFHYSRSIHQQIVAVTTSWEKKQ